MSVRRCGRSDCKHIMCSRLILDGSAYICGDCYEELMHFKKVCADWAPRMSKEKVRRLIEYFMTTPTGTYTAPQGMVDTDEEFDRLIGAPKEG